MPSRFQDRLNRAASRAFVGRDAELAHFRSLVNQPEPDCLVLLVYGPGGIGKTSLLRAFARECTTAGIEGIHLDARTFADGSVGFLRALAAATGTDAADPVSGLADRKERFVLLVDTFELMEETEPWMIRDFLPSLPENVLVVLAGRHPPSDEWHREPGWRTLMRPMPLRNLRRTDAEGLLRGAGVPETMIAAMFAPTHGHPLALSLVLEIYQLRAGEDFDPSDSPDVVRALVERLVMKVPSPSHRLALEACALTRWMTEELLAAMLDTPDASAIFAWLRSLSFVDSGPGGVYPHDVAREALAADLRWRNPGQYRELHRRARGYYIGRMNATPNQREQRHHLRDFVFLHRENPVVQPLYARLRSDTSGASDVTETLRSDRDAEEIASVIARHEGKASAQWSRKWMKAAPESVTIFKDGGGKLAGVLFTLNLGEVPRDLLLEDPGTRTAWKHLEASSPLRPGERASMFRFWMGTETYQGLSHVQMSIFVHMVQHYLMTPGLAFTYLPSGITEDLEPVLAYGDIYRIPDADFEIEGRPFGMFGHDWRIRNPDAWLDLMGQRQVGAVPGESVTDKARSLIVLSREDFDSAVQEGLRHVVRSEKMHANPLLQSSMVVARAESLEEADRIEALRVLLVEAVASLEGAPRMDKAFRALDRTYLRPAGSQEAAAELLDIPYSTFRRHLAKGVEEVAESLWRLEVGSDR